MEKFSNKIGYIKLSGNSSELTIDSHFGALPISWKVHGKELLFCPEHHKEIIGKRMCGIPLMYPFANRLNPEILTVAGRVSRPIHEIPGLLRDGNQSIMHGLLLWRDDWKVMAQSNTSVTYALDWNASFWGYSYLPIQHLVQMTFAIEDNALQVQVSIENRDSVELPISFGFHPYFLLDRTEDYDAEIKIPARFFNQTDAKLFPTGIREEVEKMLKPDGTCRLGSVVLDTCFVDLMTNENQQVTTNLSTPTFDLEISMDDAFKNLIVYLPQDKVKPYICIEPMIAATNAWHSQTDLRWLKGGDTFLASFVMKATIKN